MRRPFVILLVAPMTLGGLAYANSALRATPAPRFALTISPAAQTTARGAAVHFSIDIRRSGGFRGHVRLTLSPRPAGVRASWELPNGARTTAPARVLDGALLTLQVSTRATLGRHRAILRATGGGRTVRRHVWLTVARPLKRRFSLVVSPARQTVARGDIARYRVRVRRIDGLRGRIWLRVLRVPRGERATFTPGVVTVATSRSRPTGTHRLVVSATAWVRGRRVRRYAVVTLAPTTPRRFTIAGDLSTPLSPGAAAPLDLTLSNPNTFVLRIRALSVRATPVNGAPGCTGSGHYTVRQYAGRYPLVLHPGRTQLSALVSEPGLWPQIGMRDLARNQDACKGRVVRLDYTGLATR